MLRQVVLDTETTGIKVEEGHRIIEIGCVELIDRKLTGRVYHQYVNPLREIEAGAQAVHGITSEFLKDKPNFGAISSELLGFIKGAELIIHNAPFDLSFLNYEMSLIESGIKSITELCQIIDTLKLARTIHVGQRNNLDALCKRYHIDNSKREYHGALLDAHLLAQVYLRMTGGQGNFFESFTEIENKKTSTKKEQETNKQDFKVMVLKATPEELIEHDNYLTVMASKQKCMWKEQETDKKAVTECE